MRGVFMSMPMAVATRGAVLMGFLLHHQRLVGALFVSLMGNLGVRIDVGDLRRTDRAVGKFTAIRAIDRIEPAAHGLELFETSTTAALIFIQWHRIDLSSCNIQPKKKLAGPWVPGRPV